MHWIDSLIHWLIHSRIRSFIGQWFIDSLNHRFSMTQWYFDSLIHWPIGSLVHPFIDSVIRWRTYSLSYLCMDSFMAFHSHLKHHVFIHPCTSRMQQFIASASQNLFYRPLISSASAWARQYRYDIMQLVPVSIMWHVHHPRMHALLPPNWNP